MVSTSFCATATATATARATASEVLSLGPEVFLADVSILVSPLLPQADAVTSIVPNIAVNAKRERCDDSCFH